MPFTSPSERPAPQTSPIISLPDELLSSIVLNYTIPPTTLENLTNEDINTPLTSWVSNTLQTLATVCERRKALFDLIRVSKRFYNLLANNLYESTCLFIPDIRSIDDFTRGENDYRVDTIVQDSFWAKHDLASLTADRLRALFWVSETKTLVCRNREVNDKRRSFCLDSSFLHAENVQLLNCSISTLRDLLEFSKFTNLKTLKIDVDLGDYSNDRIIFADSEALGTCISRLRRHDTALESLTIQTRNLQVLRGSLWPIGIVSYSEFKNLRRLSVMKEHLAYQTTLDSSPFVTLLPKTLEELQVLFGKEAYDQFLFSEVWVVQLLDAKPTLVKQLRKVVVIGVIGREEGDTSESFVPTQELRDVAGELGVDIEIKVERT
ncbi:hypothetical protein GLAREA_07350 [Glarea lozoyensis ATCC 20868]|uniref:F-box domain-containing protein n=1 Tax=Glarea lozoyensis (strain ATCC 20868 / MF5171) TaxID=1116229 RepID=S3D120_GLAL2|nr:uncharacterized protein GLAREA_07350 [Glarea lozoyensis ATCC 20868]EPE32217.1 hypothetical protein GLAREA_07350 [Glarea lozoyensis ATCC 20868]